MSPPAHPHPDAARAVGPKASPAIRDELCGVKDEDRARSGEETVAQHVARLTEPLITRWKNALAASGDPRRQAIALALTNVELGARVINPEELASGNEPSKDNPANNNLVLRAIESRDPAIYALAMGQCRSLVTDDMLSGSCQGLSFEDWASIDPDNGMPWLWLAAKAQHAGDQQGIDGALAKAAAAARIESYGSTLSGLALGALPGDTAPLERAAAGAEVISIWRIGTPLAVGSLCSPEAIGQPQRKQQCSAIATLLADHGSTLIDVAIASSLAERVRLPEGMQVALKAERRGARAVLNWSNPWDLNDSSGFHCEKVLAYDGYVDALRAAGGNERLALRAMETARQQASRNSSSGR